MRAYLGVVAVAVLCNRAGAAPPREERFDHLVREDLFCGFAGDNDLTDFNQFKARIGVML